jgi:glycosyltransferase involved in cell wall biosynthesis
MLALSRISSQSYYYSPTFLSAYDNQPDEKYTNKHSFRGFNQKRIWFSIYTIFHSFFKSDIIILGHINLALIGCVIKYCMPWKKVILIVHGIEVWQPQSGWKRLILYKANQILTVSKYTQSRILKNHESVKASKFIVFPNTIDPFYQFPKILQKPTSLLHKYGIDEKNPILLTVSRLEKHEKYKGYDLVLEILPEILLRFPDLRYLIIGKSDTKEFERIREIIEKNNLNHVVKLLGYISDNELIEHYLLADCFVMPSQKEGFGIVFIEAVMCGLHVIAGGKDGSREALLDGDIGELVNPDSKEEIKLGIIKTLQNPLAMEEKLKRKEKVIEAFGFEQFKQRLNDILNSHFV